MDDRARRVGENEILYRAVNERIKDLNRAFGAVAETMNVVCECGDAACTQQIEIDVPAYERVRANPTLFVVRPGHEEPGVEDVAERMGGYVIVRKRHGGPAELAEATDPRG